MGRLGALAGVGFFVFLVASLEVGSSALSSLDVSGASAVQDWAERRSELKLRVALVEVAAFFGLVFTVELKVRLDAWGAKREALLAFAGGLVLVGTVAASGWVSAAVLAVDDLGNEPQAAKAFLLLDWSFDVGMSAALAVMVAGVSTAALRFRTLPVWLAFVGLIVLAMFVVNAAWWQTGIMSVVGLVWLPIVGLVLAIKGE